MDFSTIKSNWNYPTTMWFGAGRLAEIDKACQQLNITHPLIVTDPGLVKMHMVQELLAYLNEACLPSEVFADIKPNPVGGNVDNGVTIYRQGMHDGVIALGGGSAMDAAKSIALMAGQKRPLWDFVDEGDNYMRVIEEGVAPLIAIPTTAGTGSEVGRAAVIVDEEAQTKKLIFHPKMLPAIVIADPELTLGLPPALTAATGMDALAHNLEALCAPGFHPMADGIAMEGIKLIKESLIAAFRDGNDINARSKMLAAASMGATAFQKGLGAVHSLSHPLGAIYDAHHGTLNAILMPYVLKFNEEYISEQIASLAGFIGLEPSFAAFLNWLIELRHELDIPHTLRDYNIDLARVDEIARFASLDPSAASNPRPLDDATHKEIMQKAVEGIL